MKKILAFLLVALTVAALFVVPASAADDKNYKVTVPGVKKGQASPVPDGVVKAGEYVSKTPIHSFSANRGQFNTDHDEYGDWDVDFYTCWDADNLYLAWVVHSDIQVGMPSSKLSAAGGLGNMWEYSCVQFILTPGAPDGTPGKYQTDKWAGNYLECGLTLVDNKDAQKVAWSAPVGLTTMNTNDWDGAIKRDEAAKTTTYEVRIPWKATGVQVKGDNAQFGLTYAVAAQEQYTSVKKGMLEWQDAILGSKNADNAAVMTLEPIGDEPTVIVPVDPVLKEGEVPAEVKDATCITLDGLNKAITGEKAYLITKPTKENIASYNTKYALGLLLEPVEGKTNTYKLVEKVQGAAADKEVIEFTTDIKDGMILALIHSDGQKEGAARRDTAAGLEVGSELYLFGVDVAKGEQLYSNAALYVTSATVVDDSSAEESSKEESSKPESKPESKTESSKVESTPASSTAEEEGGLSTTAIVLIVIGGLIIIGAVVAVIIVKKKKK